MSEYLIKTMPMADILWSAETSREPLDTPERRAGLEQRLKTLIATITDPGVRKYYQDDMRRRIFDLFRPAQAPVRSGPPIAVSRGRFSGPRRNFAIPTGSGPATIEVKRSPMAAGGGSWNVGARREQLILATVLHHPQLLERHLDALCDLGFLDPALDRLRAAIIEVAAAYPDLETRSLHSHLVERGFGGILDKVSSASALSGDWFCGPDAAFADAEAGWMQTVNRHYREIYWVQAIFEAEQALAADFSLENEQNLMILQQQRAEDAEDELIVGFGVASGRIVKS